MNDRKAVHSPSNEPSTPPLLRDFCSGLRELLINVRERNLTAKEAEQQGLDLFQILIERNGLMVDQSNHVFWEDTRKRLLRYFEIPKDHFNWLSKVQEDNTIEQWAVEQLARYKSELKAPNPISHTLGGFSSRFLRFF